MKLVLIIVGLIALKHFYNFDLVEWAKTPAGQKILLPIWEGIKNLYSYLDGVIGAWIAK